MRVGEVELEGYVMPDSPLSLISVDDLCVQGWAYVQNALSAWYREGGVVLSFASKSDDANSSSYGASITSIGGAGAAPLTYRSSK